jgi:hypothetical protein
MARPRFGGGGYGGRGGGWGRGRVAPTFESKLYIVYYYMSCANKRGVIRDNFSSFDLQYGTLALLLYTSFSSIIVTILEVSAGIVPGLCRS